ncbi:MAG: 2-oxoacid:acceptor oxidoreductase subunit alpha, partial [Thermodesulfovibrio sp.]|nr:2-oxoacid:acceptor oxidoreductase subunit alpha [Thermodesulfovibrio sp.]
GSPEQAFYLTNKSFDLAEKYQITAIILTDQYLADSQWSYLEFDLSKLKSKAYRLRGATFKSLKEYKRHLFTETGISPLGVPGDANHLVVTDSDEHDEEGHIIEDAETRIKMVEKRLFKKLPLIKKEISPPNLYGEGNPEIVLVCWGSTYGIVREVVDELSDKFKIAMLHFSEIYPFSEDKSWLNILQNAKLILNIEQNATSQFAKLIMMETGLEIKRHINRFDGRPFTVDELKEKVYAYIRGL